LCNANGAWLGYFAIHHEIADLLQLNSRLTPTIFIDQRKVQFKCIVRGRKDINTKIHIILLHDSKTVSKDQRFRQALENQVARFRHGR
jgi:hypothetical protein